jgi:hypothetical protein
VSSHLNDDAWHGRKAAKRLGCAGAVCVCVHACVLIHGRMGCVTPLNVDRIPIHHATSLANGFTSLANGFSNIPAPVSTSTSTSTTVKSEYVEKDVFKPPPSLRLTVKCVHHHTHTHNTPHQCTQSLRRGPPPSPHYFSRTYVCVFYVGVHVCVCVRACVCVCVCSAIHTPAELKGAVEALRVAASAILRNNSHNHTAGNTVRARVGGRVMCAVNHRSCGSAGTRCTHQGVMLLLVVC